jgi:hypothetical protein
MPALFFGILSLLVAAVVALNDLRTAFGDRERKPKAFLGVVALMVVFALIGVALTICGLYNLHYLHQFHW